MTASGGSAARPAIAVAIIMAVVGVPVGVLWWLVAPRVEATVVEGGITLSQTAAQTFVAADGWFAILTLVAGIACGGALAVRGRPDGPAAAIALVVGGLLAALVAWRVGVFLGRAPDPLAGSESATAAVGTTVTLALELRATGVILAWAIGALGTFFAATLVASRKPLESGWPGDVRGGRPGEPHQVGGREFDFEPTPPRGDEHGGERER